MGELFQFNSSGEFVDVDPCWTMFKSHTAEFGKNETGKTVTCKTQCIQTTPKATDVRILHSKSFQHCEERT